MIIIDPYRITQFSGNVEQLTIAVELNPSEQSGYYNLGYANTYLGNYAEAVAFFEKGLEFETYENYSVETHYHLGEVYYEMGNYEKAEPELRTFVEYCQHEDTSWMVVGSVMLGHTQVELGKYDKDPRNLSQGV